MRRLFLISALLLGCVPNLGSPPSLVTGPRVLAIRGNPPEARPGVDAQFDLLVASPDGTVSSGAVWSFCTASRPPADNNVVSDACLQDGFQTEQAGPAPTFDAAVPMNACTLFGPDTPSAMAGQLPPRPTDPDVTGGYYQPLRVKVSGASAEGEAAFGLERITCDLANAPVDISQAFAKSYTANTNPVLSTVTASRPGEGEAPVTVAGGEPSSSVFTTPHGATINLIASWTAASRESFPVYDVTSLSLVTNHESLRLSWFASGGRFAHDVTGRTSAETETDTANQWTAPATPGVVHFWVVLRDNRGGVDFGGFDVTVQ